MISDVISSVDVSVAFLQADPYPDDHPKRYVMYQPDRSIKAKYYLLRGAIYGQRSASREWYDTLAGWLESKGYHKKEDEPCAFINDKGFTVLSYVDDLICRGSMEETEKFYELLADKFDCKDYNILSLHWLICRTGKNDVVPWNQPRCCATEQWSSQRFLCDGGGDAAAWVG